MGNARTASASVNDTPAPPRNGEAIIEIDGIAFHVRIDGPAAGPWLVFSNSLMTSLSLWDDQVAAFAGTHRILRYDQRGHGATAVAAAAPGFDRLADDVVALMDHFAIDRATFIGISMGAATGFALAARHPARVSRLALADGQAATAPGGADAWDARIALARKDGMAGLVEPTLERWFTAPNYTARIGAVARVAAMIAATPSDGFIEGARCLQSFDYRAALGAIEQPVLLLAGVEDGRLPETMAGIAAALPHGRFEAITDAGHLSNIEAPQAFNRALAAFLSEAVPARDERSDPPIMAG